MVETLRNDRRFAAASARLFDQWKAMVSPATLVRDALAGVVVAFVALPLNLAFALAAHVDARVGLTSGIVGGLVAALFGGSKFAVSGPAAVMAILLVNIVQHTGWEGLLTASFLCGVWQLSAGLCRLGTLARLVPRPVVSGFTGGLAVLIILTQFRPLLGLDSLPDHTRFELTHLSENWEVVKAGDCLLGLLSLVAIWFWPSRYYLPGGLVAIIVGVAGGELLRVLRPEFSITRLVPMGLVLDWPATWNVPWQFTDEILLASVELALLASLQSVLCALSCDGQTGTRHDANQELIGQGLANVIVPFFGGLPVTGVFARSAAGIRAGGQTRMTAVFHAIVLLILATGLTPFIAAVPAATLAAILFVTGWRLFPGKESLKIWKASRPEGAVLVTTLALTAVTTNMALGMMVGTFAAVIFVVWRAARQFEKLSLCNRSELDGGRIVVCRLEGPLFFATVPTAIEAIERERAENVVVNLEHTWGLDTTVCEALGLLAARLLRRGQRLSLRGIREDDHAILKEIGLHELIIANDGSPPLLSTAVTDLYKRNESPSISI